MKDLNKLDPDLVLNISQICRNEDTGQLKLKSKTVSGYIIFYEGKIVWAVSDFQEATLGELMVKTGKISREHFKLAKKMHAEAGGDRKITEILANISNLSEQDFRDSMRSHIQILSPPLNTPTSSTKPTSPFHSKKSFTPDFLKTGESAVLVARFFCVEYYLNSSRRVETIVRHPSDLSLVYIDATPLVLKGPEL